LPPTSWAITRTRASGTRSTSARSLLRRTEPPEPREAPFFSVPFTGSITEPELRRREEAGPAVPTKASNVHNPEEVVR